MTSPAPHPTPQRGDLSDDADIDHISCCADDDTALCGADVTDAPEALGPGHDCVECHTVVWTERCPRHGRCPLDPLALS